MGKLFKNAVVVASGAIVAAILAPVLAKGLTPAPAPGFAPDDACVGNSRLLMKAVRLYLQDNDESLPPMDSTAHFQAAVSPYISNTSVFSCPATHLAFQPNPAIGLHSLAEYATPGEVIVFQDAVPHADHKSVATFLDGHIEVGGAIAGGGTPAGDPDLVCADRVRAISLAMLQYVQDYDQIYPPMDTPAHVQTLLLPYAKSTSIFVCPSTGQPYAFNASLSYVAQAALDSPATTVVVQDPVAHANSLRVIGYADGHVNHPGTAYSTPETGDAANLKRIGLGILQYAQDYDEYMPDLRSPEALKAAVYPYVRSEDTFVNPFTGQSYLYNAAYSGWSLAMFDSPATMWLARDRTPNSDGTLNVLFADGHVKTRYTYVAQHISVGPNSETRLLWNRGDGSITLSRLSSTGAEINRAYLGLGVGTVKSVSTSSTGYTSILIGKGDTASLWTLNPSFYVTQKTEYGPYDGWAPISVGVGSNNQPRLLWNRYDKSSAIWQASAVNDYISDKRYALASGDIASGLAVAPDNSQRLVWTRPSGEVRFWTLSAAGDILSQSGVPPYHDWKAKSVTVGPNGNTWVLFAGTGGSSLMTMSPTQQRLNKIDFPAEAGWTPQEVGVGA
ncbi:MAG: WD40 repeat domain-containing protein, partial [Capsulimonas sp.]|uniref:WD40 repeat domain-containing protein n=1 Tax=Capsulimonas sp. TaxID=2494211 RepID=UPI003266579E